MGFLCSFLIGHTFKLNRHTPTTSSTLNLDLSLTSYSQLMLYTSECLLVCMRTWGGVLTSVCIYTLAQVGGGGSCRRLSYLSLLLTLSSQVQFVGRFMRSMHNHVNPILD